MSTRQQFLLDSDDISSHEFRIDDKPGRTYRIVQRYTLKTVSIVFLTLLVIIETSIIVCWSLSASKTSTRQDNASDQVPNRDLDSLCFPCNAIGKNISSSDIGHIIRFDKETNLCCMEDVGNLKNFFLLIINEYYRNVEANSSESSLDHKDETAANSTESEDSDEVQVGAVAGHVGGSNSKHLKLKAPYISEPGNKVKDFWTKREAAAHMFLDNALLRNTNNTAQRLPWDGRDYHNLSMTSDFLTYDPDKRSIQVKAMGLYFVYSSVTLQAPTNDHNAQVYHMLLREHYLLPVTGSTIMMMNKYGGGELSTGFYSSFLCGSFRLRGGDELFVKVSNSSFLYNAYYSNYLGLYRLSV